MRVAHNFFGTISAQPHTSFMHIYTFCDSNSIHARPLCKRVSMTVMYVQLMYGVVRKSFHDFFEKISTQMRIVQNNSDLR